MAKEKSKVFVGMGGWDLFPFDNVFYPPKVGKGFRKLEYYSQYFDFIEVNATFYNNAFSPERAKQWLEDVSGNKDFVFAVKLYKGFTHTFDATREDVLIIHHFLDEFAKAGKLVGLLIQFPYSLTNTIETRNYLLHLAKAFQPHPLFVEVRHKSWNQPIVLNLLRENGLHLVNVDLPGIKQHMPLTREAWDNQAYFRMMGRNVLTWDRSWKVDEAKTHVVSDRYLYNYTEVELKALAGLIEGIQPKAQKTFVVFHNDPQANSLVNGFQLRHLIGKKPLLIPANLLKAKPVLKPISAETHEHLPLFSQFSSSGSRHSGTSFAGEFTSRETG